MFRLRGRNIPTWVSLVAIFSKLPIVTSRARLCAESRPVCSTTPDPLNIGPTVILYEGHDFNGVFGVIVLDK